MSRRELIVHLYDSGFSLREIARAPGVRMAYTTVRNELIRAGVKLRPRGPGGGPEPLPQAEVLRTLELYRSGRPLPDIAGELGLSVSGLHKRIREAGERRRHRRLAPIERRGNGPTVSSERFLEWLEQRRRQLSTWDALGAELGVSGRALRRVRRQKRVTVALVDHCLAQWGEPERLRWIAPDEEWLLPGDA
jgi:hypothetical protein